MTLKNLMTTSALSMLLATSAVAQTTAPADGTAPMAADGMMEAETMAPQSLSDMTVGDLTGTDVMDANGESIGSIIEVVQGATEGQAVVGIGGFLGIGQYDVALPLSDLTYNAEDGVISVTLTEEEMEALPEYISGDMEPLPPEAQLSTLMADTSEADEPAMEAPATDAPETDMPETDAPATDAPEMDAQATDAPETDAPAPEGTAPEGTDTDDTMETDTEDSTDTQ